VDKTIFLHRLNGLRVFEGLVQALFLGRMLTGQKKAVHKWGSSAHSILWICMGLSTVGLVRGRGHAFLVAKWRGPAGFAWPGRVEIEGVRKADSSAMTVPVFFRPCGLKNRSAPSGRLANSVDRHRRRRLVRQTDGAEAVFFSDTPVLPKIAHQVYKPKACIQNSSNS
jgi:hypothetical protein